MLSPPLPQGLLAGTAAFSTENFISTVSSEETTEFPVPSVAEFFAMGYSRGLIRQHACYDKLRADGYYERLTFDKRLCICMYNPRNCQRANYQMTPEEKELGAKAFEESRRLFLELLRRIKYEEQLPRTIGLSTFLLAVFVVGVIGK